jgi:hypothetical protein
VLAVGEKVLERGNCDDRGGVTSFVLVLLSDDRAHTLGIASLSGPSGCPCPAALQRPFEAYRADVDGDGITDLVVGSNGESGDPTIRLLLGSDSAHIAAVERVRDGATVERAGKRIVERRAETNTEASFRILGAAGFGADQELVDELQKEDRMMAAARELARVSSVNVRSAEIRSARAVLGL